MSNPYDIYDNGSARHGRFTSIVESPYTAVGWAATDFLAVPLLSSEKALQRSMTPGAWSRFKDLASRSRFGGAADAARNLALHGRPSDFLGGQRPFTIPSKGLGGPGASLAEASAVRSITERSRLFHKGLTQGFGAQAARRIGISRMLQGASRGLFAYSMLQLGIGLMRGINDMIEAYTPPEPKVPWHRDLETGGGFVDTRSAQTQRQMAIQAIHNTQLSTRAALGNEASFLHMAHG